ncbi:hemerythrin domain-containing protein [Anaeromicrobium sediminis]|uniref:Cation-binding protein n=1 Tax=Anaeromicrobium sediminis TaxID=1478221 RepID=A0A267MMW7_9FIRM|nr:hemerythrin domain-containing protein [Anaeromicrobium sediminis]PAB60163.1 cation-binding protein [Anaeromicrobium sediminis]
MSNIDNLVRQHVEIKNNINTLKNIISNKNLEDNSFEIAKLINTLAGKLKVHLSSEDKHLYPRLLQDDNDKIRKTAEVYNDEMKDVYSTFTDFKMKYNTKNKINDNIISFREDTRKILNILENRIKKEDLNLFPLLK